VYGFNHLSPLNLLPLPNISDFENKDVQAKVEYVKRLHEQVKAQIAEKNESYAKQANKNKKEVVLELGDWVGNT